MPAAALKHKQDFAPVEGARRCAIGVVDENRTSAVVGIGETPMHAPAAIPAFGQKCGISEDVSSAFRFGAAKSDIGGG